jgi:hypothetical protein
MNRSLFIFKQPDTKPLSKGWALLANSGSDFGQRQALSPSYGSNWPNSLEGINTDRVEHPTRLLRLPGHSTSLMESFEADPHKSVFICVLPQCSH